MKRQKRLTSECVEIVFVVVKKPGTKPFGLVPRKVLDGVVLLVYCTFGGSVAVMEH